MSHFKDIADLAELFSGIEQRYLRLGPNQEMIQSFLMHLKSLANWGEDAMDYPDVAVEYPEKVHVAFAVCHPNCGRRELVVDGSTQECQRCGSLLFRLGTACYRRVDENS